MKLKYFRRKNGNDNDDDDDDIDSGLILPCLTLEHHAKARVLAALCEGPDLKIVQMKKIIQF